MAPRSPTPNGWPMRSGTLKTRQGSAPAVRGSGSRDRSLVRASLKAIESVAFWAGSRAVAGGVSAANPGAVADAGGASAVSLPVPQIRERTPAQRLARGPLRPPARGTTGPPLSPGAPTHPAGEGGAASGAGGVRVGGAGASLAAGSAFSLRKKLNIGRDSRQLQPRVGGSRLRAAPGSGLRARFVQRRATRSSRLYHSTPAAM